MSANSCSSQRRCHCRELGRSFTSGTSMNPGRRFFKCPKSENKSCGYWEWRDEVYSERAMNVITSLKADLRVATIKIETLNDALKVANGEKGRLMIELDKLRNEVDKAKDLKEKLMMFKCVVVILVALFVGYFVALMYQMT